LAFSGQFQFKELLTILPANVVPGAEITFMTRHLGSNINEDTCPVPEDLFGQLRQAHLPDAVEAVKDMPESQRARLAAFCYNKRHLYSLGLMIASTCSRSSLVGAAGNAGGVIFRQSRNAAKTFSEEILPPGYRPKKAISLAQVNNDT